MSNFAVNNVLSEICNNVTTSSDGFDALEENIDCGTRKQSTVHNFNDTTTSFSIFDNEPIPDYWPDFDGTYAIPQSREEEWRGARAATFGHKKGAEQSLEMLFMNNPQQDGQGAIEATANELSVQHAELVPSPFRNRRRTPRSLDSSTSYRRLDRDTSPSFGYTRPSNINTRTRQDDNINVHGKRRERIRRDARLLNTRFKEQMINQMCCYSSNWE